MSLFYPCQIEEYPILFLTQKGNPTDRVLMRGAFESKIQELNLTKKLILLFQNILYAYLTHGLSFLQKILQSLG